MACRTPIRMYRRKEGRDRVTGSWPLVSNPRDGCIDLPVEIPCGRCIHCRLANSRGKTIRLVHELQYHDTACFLTLTYDDDNIPIGPKGVPTLTRGQKGDVTLFLKRLRHFLPNYELKYFNCGEYGDRTARPHHHIVLYGYDFIEDRQLVQSSPMKLYSSNFLDSVWQKGGCRIGTVTWDSASYVASYCVKKLTGEMAKEAYDDNDIIPPYMTSSLAIGKQWILDWIDDVYPRDRIFVRGHASKPPRYYDDVLKSERPDLYKQVIRNRQDNDFDDSYFDNAIPSIVKKEKELQFYKNPTF